MTYEEAQTKLDRTTDGLGLGIDPGIKHVVAALMARDFITNASCEGHIDRALPYPWVQLSIPKDSKGVYEKANREQHQKIEELLAEFYKGRKTDIPIQVRDIGIFGAFRLQSVAKGEDATRSIEDYQDEMNAFADYLVTPES